MDNRQHSSRELPRPGPSYTPTFPRPPLDVLWMRDIPILLPPIYGPRQNLLQPLPTLEPHRVYSTVHPLAVGHPQRYPSPPETVRHHRQRNQPPAILGPELAPLSYVPPGSETLPANLGPHLLPRYVPRLALAGSDPWTTAWPPAPPPPPPPQRERSSSVVTTIDHPRHGPQERTFQHYDNPDLPYLTTNEAVRQPVEPWRPLPEDEEDERGPRVLMMDLTESDSPEPESEEEEPTGNTGESAEGAGEGPSGVSRHDTPGETGVVAGSRQAGEQAGLSAASIVVSQGHEDLKRKRDSEEDESEGREGKRQETGGKA